MPLTDAAKETAAYLAELPPSVHAKALAYTQGGHWLLLWSWLVGVLAAWLVLRSGILTRTGQRLAGGRPRPRLTAFVVSVVFFTVTWVISLPWSVYSDWWREKSYGLTSQTLGGWFGEQVVMGLISTLIAALFFAIVYAFIRRWPRRWWIAAGGLTAVFFVVALLIAPVFIEPLFNHYTPAPSGPVRDAVVTLAKVSGVPSDKIYIYNGSKQSNRYTANVSGLFGSARVAMSDTMFKQGADLAEVRGVVGHEMGHYAHYHGLWMAAAFSLLGMLVFWATARMYPSAARALGVGSTGIGDPTGLPVLMIVFSTLLLLATPLLNSITRLAEADADRFSLAHAREPDGLSKALVKTIEYRAASPGWIEEVIFYDHPSVGRRIRRAMDWKAAHPPSIQP